MIFSEWQKINKDLDELILEIALRMEAIVGKIFI